MIYENKLILGDMKDIVPQLPNEIFDVLIFDFPYNKKMNIANDNLSPKEFRKLLRDWIKIIIPKLKINGSLYCFMQYDYFDYLKSYLKKYLIFKREIIWHYKHGTSLRCKRNYLSEFDKILFFVKGDDYTFNILRQKPSKATIERWKNYVDENGRIPYKYLNPSTKKKFKNEEDYEKRSSYSIYDGKPLGNIFKISKVGSFGKNNKDIKYGKHDTQKPEKLIDIFIKVSSNEGDLIGDFFCGSGTTLVCAKRLRRKYFGCEIMSKYYEMAKNRLENTHQFKNILKHINS